VTIRLSGLQAAGKLRFVSKGIASIWDWAGAFRDRIGSPACKDSVKVVDLLYILFVEGCSG